jgi:hypothetical protein
MNVRTRFIGSDLSQTCRCHYHGEKCNAFQSLEGKTAMNDPIKRPDPSIAERALKEAAQRKTEAETQGTRTPREIGGRGGEDPARYGDWEIKGIACDF